MTIYDLCDSSLHAVFSGAYAPENISLTPKNSNRVDN
jgi:hypothetical protein